MFPELAQIVEAILGSSAVTPADRLTEDLEAESMDLVNIAAAVEERYGIVLDEARLAQVRTVGDLHAVVEAARAAS